MRYYPKVYLAIAIVISILLSFLSVNNPKGLIWSDMEGYYVYLPAVVIYGDFKKEAVRDTNYIRPFQGTEKILTKYTCGVALLEAPFFLMAHVLSNPLGYTSDGHSLIYGYGLMFAGLFYFWLGLWMLYKVASRYFSPKTVLTALIGLVLGTNLYYYTFFQPAMSHVFSFFLFAVFLLLSDSLLIQKKVTRHNTLLLWAVYGLVSGLIILVRPTNIIVLIIPLYILSKQKEWISFLKDRQKQLFLYVLMFWLILLPQLLYWKYISGNWILWSYDQENFRYWKEPKLFRVLFDAWNGWILYSPIVIFPLLFLIKNRHSNKNYERVYLYIFAIATYVFASWWAWWFGGAFGHRSYVEYLAFLVLPFCGFIEWATQKGRVAKTAFYALFFVCCYYSTGMTYLYNAPWDGERWTYLSVLNEVKKLFFIKS